MMPFKTKLSMEQRIVNRVLVSGSSAYLGLKLGEIGLNGTNEIMEYAVNKKQITKDSRMINTPGEDA